MASCWSVPRRPRLSAGATSAMYAGPITAEIPTPKPPRSRQSTSAVNEKERPDINAEIEYRMDAKTMTRTRPKRFDAGPANQAPIAAPRLTMDTTRPVCQVVKPNPTSAPVNAATAPLMTATSKPKRNPPSAAAIATPQSRRV